MSTAYFKDGPKAGDFTYLPEGTPVMYYPVYETEAFVARDLKSPPMPEFKKDEYRRLGTVELYEYVGRSSV
jgi:hypothetical protein